MLTEWPLAGLDVDVLNTNGWRSVPFQQFILKVHSRCNLACDYCYMYQLADDSWRTAPRVMSPSILTRSCQRIVDHVIKHQTERIEVVLHGGEPLLAGTETLATIARILGRDLPDTVTLNIMIQTNGVLLSEPMLRIFSEHGIRVGVSLDGAAEDHDRHRHHANGRGSHTEASRALELLNHESYRQLYAGLLCVVDPNIDPVRTYESLLSFAPPMINFLLPHGNWSSPPPRRSPGTNDTPYGDWLIMAFDRWYGAPRQETEVRLFAEIINMVLGGDSHTESVGLSPVALIAINTDGSLEQVDTLRSAFNGASAIGMTVFNSSLDDALGHPAIAARQIGLAALGEKCQGCELRNICGGGQYPHRYRRGSGFRNSSVYCPDLTKLIKHIANRVRTDLLPR